MLKLNYMDPPVFEKFKESSWREYANQLSVAEEITFNEAVDYAYEQFRKMTLKGLSSNNDLFFEVVHETTLESVGYLWVGFQKRHKQNVAQINDIIVKEPFRGKGYGKEIMKEIESLLRKMGIVKLRLHVFVKNEVAMNLYESLGFKVLSQDMMKVL